MPRFVAIGECMVELSQAGNGLLQQGFAGDTLNTAWYARACLPDDWAVDYATLLGRDALSDRIEEFIGAAGIGTERISRHPERMPGLYLILLRDGERSFIYWRDRSAARCLADDPAWLDAAMAGADVIYVSGITLAILQPAGRELLRERLSRARLRGARVVFDPNLRPQLWPDVSTMRAETEAAARIADILLPSHEDEASHFGDADPMATASRYLSLGAAEVLVKNGGGQMVAALAGEPAQYLPHFPRVVPIDTTGAGDSFNGGYLAARLAGADQERAARAGHGVAMRVVAHHGALLSLSQI